MDWTAYRALEPRQPIGGYDLHRLIAGVTELREIARTGIFIFVAETRHDQRPFDPHLHNRPRRHLSDRNCQRPRRGFWDARRTQAAAMDVAVSGDDHSDERYGVYVSNPRLYAGARHRFCFNCCFGGGGVRAVPETFDRRLALDLCDGR